MTGVNEPGSQADGEGRELGNGRAGFRHFPGRRWMGLVCIGQVNLGNIRLSAKKGMLVRAEW